MAIKILLFVFACFFQVATMALDDELLPPPVIEPEAFDQPVIQTTGELSLKEAIVLTLKHNPELATFAWTLRAREIDQIEAGLLPNPKAELEIDRVIHIKLKILQGRVILMGLNLPRQHLHLAS